MNLGGIRKEISKHIFNGKRSKPASNNLYKIKGIYLKIGYFMELLIGLIIMLQILLGSMDLLRSIYYEYILNFSSPVTYSQFETFLGQGLLLVVGVELVVMLTLHTPTAIIDALLFAISRKLLVTGTHTGMGGLFLGVMAIGLLVVIRTYLLANRKSIEVEKKYVYPAYTYITDLNESTDFNIESSAGVTLGGLIYKKSQEENRALVVENKYVIGSNSFTIKTMTEDDMIGFVEIQKNYK